MNANEATNCPCGPSCGCGPCLCTDQVSGDAPEATVAEASAGCSCE